MNDDRLTEKLADRVLGWKTAPGRFIKPGRSWIPTSRFKPFVRIEDAFELLQGAGAEYRLSATRGQIFTAEVRVGRSKGKAFGAEKARVITMALVRALELDRGSDATPGKSGIRI